MNQVACNARYKEYKTEKKAIRAKYGALKDAVLPGSPEELELEGREEAELDAAYDRFQADTPGPITPY